MEKGNHDDKKCEEYCQKYKRDFAQELPDCQFKGNKSKIQKLIRKVHIDHNGSYLTTKRDQKFVFARLQSVIEVFIVLYFLHFRLHTYKQIHMKYTDYFLYPHNKLVEGNNPRNF